MQYSSTRNKNEKVTASRAILQGIASNGGLFVDDQLDQCHIDLASSLVLSYRQLAVTISQLLLKNYPEQTIKHCIQEAYNNTFTHQDVTPVVAVGHHYVCELFHGPTAAFKDVALSLLPHYMTAAMSIENLQQEVAILTATSGDTGKAAMEGFKDIKNTRIVVFFPETGVSPIQKLQMATQEGNNVIVCGINGDFDDAQRGVKEILNNVSLDNIQLSSANSINIGRLIPQIVYYFSSYFQLVNKKQVALGEEVNFAVPTGNFGNILAGYYAKMLGLPVHKLICASNKNNVLYDFIKTGIYDRNRPLHKTISPSMDILVSSNLERFLYYVSGKDANYINEIMTSLSKTGRYQISEEILHKIQSFFFSGFATDQQAKTMIKNVYDQFHYVMDPHTAIAYQVVQDYENEVQDQHKTIIMATASPYKFAGPVYEAIYPAALPEASEFETMAQLARKTDTTIPHHLMSLISKKIRHTSAIEPTEMMSFFQKVLGEHV